MSDALRAWGQFPACRAALESVHLVETSPTLRKLQEERISALAKNVSADILHWHDSLDDVKAARDDGLFTMVIAHEFFDALPVHVVEVSKTLPISEDGTTT